MVLTTFTIELLTYSIPIAMTIKPTNLDTAFIPDAPRNLTINLLLPKMRHILMAVARIASKTIDCDAVVLTSCSKLISSDMEPGPAIMGMASGVNEMDSRLKASSFTRLSMPLCFVNFPVRSAKPDETIIIPSAMRKESNEIPKNDKMYLPAKNLLRV